jgi:mRNA interferase HigB
MNVIARKTLVHFWTRNPDSEESLEAWFQEVKLATWANSAELKSRYRTASIIDSARVVFNICGNKYRLVVRVNYLNGTVFIRFIGSHREYDKIDAKRI